MSCLYTDGFSLSDYCLDNLGGIKTFFIGNFSGSSTYEYDATGIITGGTDSPTFYTVEQRRETGMFDYEHALNIQNGTNVYTHRAAMTFHKYQASIRDLVYVMAQTETSIIVLDQNGKYFLLGEENGMNAMTSNGGSGTAFEDLAGVQINFEGKEPTPPREMSSTFFGTLTVN